MIPAAPNGSGEPVRFEKLLRLGSGGMGEVHLSEMVQGERRELVALKRLHLELLGDPEALAQFRREAAICALLSHPNVVGLRACGEDGDGPWLALEFVFGRSASVLVKAQRARGQGLPLSAALAITRDVVRGLAYAHALILPDGTAGIIHRDISPDNVLVGYDGRARLADFGIARVADATRFTRTGMVRGKAGFLAPEVLEGHQADFRSDLFSLGATLFRIVTGAHAFQGGTEGELIRAVLGARVPLASTLRADLPGWVVTWLDRLLAKDSAARPRDLARVAARLDAALAGEQAAGAAAVARCMDETFPRDSDRVRSDLTRAIERRTRTVSQRPPPRRRRAPLLALAAAGGLSLIAAASFVVARVNQSGPSKPPPEVASAPPQAADAGSPGVRVSGKDPSGEGGEAPPVEPPPPPRPPESETPMRADYPVSSFQVLAKKHVFLVPPTKAARIELDPGKTYKAWTEGKLSVGGMAGGIYLNETLYFLEGGERLAAKDRFGVVTPKPRLVKNASALYAFVLDTSPSDNSGAIRVRIQETRSGSVSSLLVDAHEQALALDSSQRFSLGNLEELASYEVTLKDGSGPARTRPGKTGRVGKVVFQQHGGELVFGGKLANETVRVLEVGKTYQMRGGQWIFFTFLDDTVEDNAGAVQIEVTALSNSGGWSRGLTPVPEPRGGTRP